MKFVIAVVIFFAAVFGVYSSPHVLGVTSTIGVPGIDINGLTDTIGGVADTAGDAVDSASDDIGDLLGGITSIATGVGGAGKPNLSAEDLTKLNTILKRVGGPKVSGMLVKLTAALANKVLKGVPVSALLKPVVALTYKLAKQGGDLEKILAGGNAAALQGKGNNLTPADQKALFDVLNRTVGPYAASFIVRTVGVVANGLLGKLHLGKLTEGVTNLVKNVANPKGIVGELIGRKGSHQVRMF